MNNILLITGPTGVGKTTLSNLLIKNFGYGRVISNTTRDPRAGEIDGIDYNFMTDAQYNELELTGDLFMSNEVYGKYRGYTRSDVSKVWNSGKIPLVEMYAPLTRQFMQNYPNTDAVYLMPASTELLVERMSRRGDSTASVEERIKGTVEEIDFYYNNFQLFRHVCGIKGIDENLLPHIDRVIKMNNPKDFRNL